MKGRTSDMTGTASAHEAPSGRLRDLADIVIFLVAEGVIVAAETRYISPDSEYGGLISLVSAMVLAWILIAVRGQRWVDLGLGRPNRLWTVPLWTIAIMATVIAAATCGSICSVGGMAMTSLRARGT